MNQISASPVASPRASPSASPRSVAVVGGGFAGLAAAIDLVEAGHRVDVFESRRSLGGRAGSFVDPATGDEIDHCQHVAMGCCAELLDLFQRTGLADAFRRDDTLHFFGPDGRRHDLRATSWLPAPLHLASSLLRLSYLSWRERFWIGHALGKLARLAPRELEPTHRAGPATLGATFGEWLRANGQSETSIRRFWSVVIVSALSDTVDVVSLDAARKVFVDAFLGGRDAYHVLVPRRPLARVARRLADWLVARGANVFTSDSVTRVVFSDGRASGIEHVARTDVGPRAAGLVTRRASEEIEHVARDDAGPRAAGLVTRRASEEIERVARIDVELRGGALAFPTVGAERSSRATANFARYDAVVVAVPWHAVGRLFDSEVFPALPWLDHVARFPPAAIHSLHLWFDREWLDLPHAVLIDRWSQWVFRHEPSAGELRRGTYCQVVISAAHAESNREEEDAILRRVLDELTDLWPAARTAKLERWRLVRQPLAVFSPRPDVERLRPSQRTGIANLSVAGDWTATGWPATMEGAVRGGRLAARAIIDYFDGLNTESNSL